MTPIIMEEASKKSWTIQRLYLLVASLVGLIGGLISIGITLSSAAEKVIITDEEYVNGQNYYELQQCKEGYYYGKTDVKDTNRKPSAEQKKACETEKKSQLLLQRQVNFKQSVLGGGIRSILFIILFATHYPRFKKQSKEFEAREGQISTFGTIQKGKHKTISLQQAEEGLIERKGKKKSIGKTIKWIVIGFGIVGFWIRWVSYQPYLERCDYPLDISEPADSILRSFSCPCYGMNIFTDEYTQCKEKANIKKEIKESQESVKKIEELLMESEKTR